MPVSLLTNVLFVSGKKVAVSVVSSIVPVHCHQMGQTKAVDRKRVLNELRFIRENPNDQQSKLFKLQHASWGRSARTHSKEYKKYQIDIEAVKIYALEHPGKSAKSIKEDCCLTLSPQSICNIIHREK